ncbi:MAG: holo-ACP synthase [Armatimonadetes bacterium]|nr:holo-ACP synthase [Candidatus Hippobium faecium]
MKIIGLGTDIEEVNRFLEKNNQFYKKCFSEREIEYCRKHKNYAENFAGRFCAKEAFTKAAGHPNEWQDVEIINNEKGKPEIILHGKAKEEFGSAVILVSVSHCREYATATVIICE